MSNWNAKHWTVLLALIGVVALHLMAAEHWADVYGNPKAVGELVLQIGTTLGALFLRKPGPSDWFVRCRLRLTEGRWQSTPRPRSEYHDCKRQGQPYRLAASRTT